MPFLTSPQSSEISDKGFAQIVRVCCKDKKSLLNHNDAFLRYCGIRKKIVIYNNTDLNILICINPAPSCFITKYQIGKYCTIDCVPVGKHKSIKVILQPKSYRKFLVPSQNVLITICGKKSNKAKKGKIESNQENDKINRVNKNNAKKFMYYQKMLELIPSFLKHERENEYDCVEDCNEEWNLLYQDYPLDTSYDVFLNNLLFEDIKKILPKIKYSDVGKTDT